MEVLETYILLRLWVKSYQRNCQKGFLRVQGNVSSGNIFLQKLYFLMFSRNKATFLGTTDNKPWEGCQKCSLEVQRTILGKKHKFWKKNWKKIPDIEWKTFGIFKNCFRCMQWNMFRKKQFTSKRHSVCISFGLWTKNTRQVCQTFTRGFQSNIFKKKMFSGRNIVYLNLGLRVKNKQPGCQTCFLHDDDKKLKWSMFF